MSSLPIKKIVFGTLAGLVFLGSIGTIGWIVNDQLKKEREYTATVPSVRDMSQPVQKSKLSSSAEVSEEVNFETKADAKKALDAMDLSVTDLDENIE